jgi:hypothetical protein
MNLAELKAVALAASRYDAKKNNYGVLLAFKGAFNPEVALKLIAAVEAARPAMEAMEMFWERNPTGSLPADSLMRVSVLKVQAALSGLRVALEAVDLGSVHLDQPVGVCTVPGEEGPHVMSALNADPTAICLPNGAMFDAFGNPRVRYVRVSFDGSHMILSTAEEAAWKMEAEAAAASIGQTDPHAYSDVYLSDVEADALPEFDGF